MKKLIATLAILGSASTLSACTTSGMGNVDSAPYADERTATHSHTTSPAPVEAPAAERVFRQVQSK